MDSTLPQVIRVSDCGTEMVNGLYRAISKQTRYGALKYANARYPNINVRLSFFFVSNAVMTRTRHSLPRKRRVMVEDGFWVIRRRNWCIML